MRNSRKKRKRQEKSEKMRAILVEKAVREVRAEADKYRSQVSLNILYHHNKVTAVPNMELMIQLILNEYY